MSDDTTPQHSVLIIEDDQSLRQMYATAFSMAKFTVFTADDGITGCEELKDKRPDIVLLDIMMPNASGYHVLDFARQDPMLANIPIIVLSNLAGESYENEARAKGAIDYIIKSDVDPKEVIAKVNKTLAARSQS